MTLKDSVQTAILVVGFFSLLVFGVSYYFVLSDTAPTQQPLKDALSITASFFGGFATLTAAYIASRLFNDWRDEKKYEIEKDLLTDILDILIKYYKFEYEISNRFIQVKKHHLSNKDIFLILRANYVEQPDFYEDFKILFSKIKHLEIINPKIKINTECNLFYKYYLILRDINKYAAMNYNMFSNFIKDPIEKYQQLRWERKSLEQPEIVSFDLFLANLRKETIINGEKIPYEDVVEKFKNTYYELNNTIINFTNPNARK